MGKAFSDKLMISLMSAAFAFGINSKYAYNLTNSLVPTVNSQGCPTGLGFLLHTLVFAVISYLRMRNLDKPDDVKLAYSIYGALILNFAFSSGMKTLVKMVIPSVVDSDNCLTMAGIGIHSLIYAGLLTGVMYLPDA